jgi:hypothetical protein
MTILEPGAPAARAVATQIAGPRAVRPLSSNSKSFLVSNGALSATPISIPSHSISSPPKVLKRKVFFFVTFLDFVSGSDSSFDQLFIRFQFLSGNDSDFARTIAKYDHFIVERDLTNKKKKKIRKRERRNLKGVQFTESNPSFGIGLFQCIDLLFNRSLDALKTRNVSCCS